MKKRSLALLLAALLTLSLAACSSSDSDPVGDLVDEITGGDTTADDTTADDTAADDTAADDSAADDTASDDAADAPAETAPAGDDIYAEDGYAQGRFGDVMHTYFFDYTINSAYTCQTFETYTAAEGNQLLVVSATVTNTATSSIEMYDTDFQAQWGSPGEEDFRYPITRDMTTYDQVEPLNAEQFPGTYTLAVDETRTGLLVYEVPAGFQDFSVSYLEMFSDSTTGDTFFVYFTADASATAGADGAAAQA